MLKRLAKDSAWILVSRTLAYAAGALFTLLVARQLGGDGFGEYAFMAALIAVGNMLTTLGTDMHLIREIAAHQDLRQLPVALALQVMLSVVFVTAVFLLPVFSFQSPQGAVALRIYSLSLLPLAFFTVFTTALRGMQQMRAYAVLNMATGLMQLLVAGVFFMRRGDLILLAGLLLLIQASAALLAGILCARALSGFWGNLRVSLKDILFLAKDSAGMASLSALNILYQRLVPALLPFLVGALQAGVYAAGARLVEAAKVGQMAAFTAMYPMMARNKGESPDWYRSFRPPALFLLGAAALTALALFVLARPLVGWLFGEAYASSVPVVRILAWIIVPFTLNTVLSLAFLAEGGENIVTGAVVAGLLGLAVLTIWWAGATGPLGAAWAALYAEVIQSAILLFQAVRRMRPAFA